MNNNSKSKNVHSSFQSLSQAMTDHPRKKKFKTDIQLQPIIFNGQGAVKKLNVSISEINIMDEYQKEHLFKLFSK